MLRTFIIYKRTTPLGQEPPAYTAAGMVRAAHENGYWGQMFGRPVFIKGAVEKAEEQFGIPKGPMMMVADAGPAGAQTRRGAGYPAPDPETYAWLNNPEAVKAKLAELQAR